MHDITKAWATAQLLSAGPLCFCASEHTLFDLLWRGPPASGVEDGLAGVESPVLSLLITEVRGRHLPKSSSVSRFHQRVLESPCHLHWFLETDPWVPGNEDKGPLHSTSHPHPPCIPLLMRKCTSSGLLSVVTPEQHLGQVPARTPLLMSDPDGSGNRASLSI